jgi:hypothetical protein
VRKYTVAGLFTLVIILISYSGSQAYVFEAHPGLRLSYEYTDNEQGVAHNKKSDSIYEIGPRLDLLWKTPTITSDLSGYLTKSYHNRFDEDDETEADIEARMAITGIRQTLNLNYSYIQTTQRETLTIPAGLTKTNMAGASYMRRLTQFLTLNLDYTYESRNEPSDGEDEVSQTGRTGITYQLDQWNSFDLSYEYDDYRYQINPDAQVNNAGLAWRYMWSQRTVIGIRSNYTKHDRDQLPDEFIYSLMPTVTYNLTQNTVVDLAAGQDWYVTKHQDRQSTFSMNGSIIYAAQKDRATIRMSRGYEAQFTSDLYGVYETKSATVSLQKEIVETLAGIIDLSIRRTTPVLNVPAIIPSGFFRSTEEETDTTGRATLKWDPNKYVTLSGIYERLHHDYETSDTVDENRYRMVLEVRY